MTDIMQRKGGLLRTEEEVKEPVLLVEVTTRHWNILYANAACQVITGLPKPSYLIALMYPAQVHVSVQLCEAHTMLETKAGGSSLKHLYGLSRCASSKHLDGKQKLFSSFCHQQTVRNVLLNVPNVIAVQNFRTACACEHALWCVGHI